MQEIQEYVVEDCLQLPVSERQRIKKRGHKEYRDSGLARNMSVQRLK